MRPVEVCYLVPHDIPLTLLWCYPTHSLYFDKMPVNEDRKGSVLSDPSSQELLLPNQVAVLALK